MRILHVSLLAFALLSDIPTAMSQPLPVPRNKPADGAATAPERAAPNGKEDPRTGVASPQAGDGAKSEQEAGRPSAPDPALPIPLGGPPFDKAGALACEAQLARKNVRFRPLDPIDEKNSCGAQRPLLIKSLGKGISLTTGVTARCPLALALAKWAQETVAPAATLHLEAKVTAISVGTSYQCRRRNNSATGKFSEHAFANGIDVMGFRFASREAVPIVGRIGSAAAERAFQAAARGAACAYFTTVLGPGTNTAHRDHLHLDLAYRSGGYRLCQ